MEFEPTVRTLTEVDADYRLDVVTAHADTERWSAGSRLHMWW